MKAILSQNKLFLSFCGLFWAVAGIYLVTHDKGSFSLYLNEHHSQAADVFFRYMTWLGDGVTIAIICGLLLFVKFRYAFVAGIVSVISSLIVNVIKNIAQEPRPAEYFKGMSLNYVNHVQLFHWHSFPSGHTAGAFALFFLLSLFAKNKTLTIIFFVLACCVALSRVYLMQHFLLDVYFGSMIGVVNASLISWMITRSKILSGGWAERSLLRLRNIKAPSNT